MATLPRRNGAPTWALPSHPVRALLPSVERVTGEQHEVRGNHRAPRVGAKCLVGAPRAAIPAEAPFEERDDALDARPEVPQALIEPGASDHLLDRQPSTLVD